MLTQAHLKQFTRSIHNIWMERARFAEEWDELLNRNDAAGEMVRWMEYYLESHPEADFDQQLWPAMDDYMKANRERFEAYFGGRFGREARADWESGGSLLRDLSDGLDDRE